MGTSQAVWLSVVIPGVHLKNSHWILGLVYINPDDARLFVPLPCKLGLAVNLGHPRSVRFLFWVWIVLILVLLAAPIVAHPSYFANNLTPLFWVISADLAALGIIYLNGSFARSDYRFIHLAGFGLIAAGIGFSLQTLVNGALVALWGTENLAWLHHLVLASVAALAQTFGKGAAVYLLLRARPVSNIHSVARYGLLIGLGFTMMEITNIYFSLTWAQHPFTSYLGLWERASSSMFHVYSSGLIALSLWSRRYIPIVLILLVHALSDFLAGASASLPFTLYQLETIFSVCAILVWGTFLLFTRILASRE